MKYFKNVFWVNRYINCSIKNSFSCILGSPLQFYVDYVNSGHVTAYGPGLIHGMVNKPAVFSVNTKDAGEGIDAHILTNSAFILFRILFIDFFYFFTSIVLFLFYIFSPP